MIYEKINNIFKSKFDLIRHKEIFIDYLKVCIDSDGNVNYAIPSHIIYMESYLFKKENPERVDEVINGYAPREWVYSRPINCLCKNGVGASSAWMEYLLEKTGLMLIINGFCIVYEPTEAQINTYKLLYDKLNIKPECFIQLSTMNV